MKKLLLILICLLIYSPSHSKWEEVLTSGEGDVTHIGIDRIKVKGENVFYWELHNISKPKDMFNTKSVMNYIQGHCDEFKYKLFEDVRCVEPMGEGGCVKNSIPNELKQWSYPIPNSIRDITLNKVCKIR